MAEQYKSIKTILDKIMRHPLLLDLSLETVVDYTVDFMRIVGVPDMFIEKTEVLEVNQYRAVLPCDYYLMIQVRKCGGGTFRYTTDSFHMSEDKGETTGLTYKIQNNVIFTSLREGLIEISYRAIAVDSEGYPLIPENSSFTRALELYIKKQHFTILFDMGLINQASFLNVQQEYAWAVGDCASEFNRLSLDKAESFYNSWRTLLIRDYEHNNGFKNDGARQIMKIH